MLVHSGFVLQHYQIPSVLSVWYIFRLIFIIVDLKCQVTSMLPYCIHRLLNFVGEYSNYLCCIYVNHWLLNPKQESVFKCEHNLLCICLRERFSLGQYWFFASTQQKAIHFGCRCYISGNLPESGIEIFHHPNYRVFSLSLLHHGTN